VTTSSKDPRRLRPSSRLVPHEIRIRRKELGREGPGLLATVRCERRNGSINVEACAYCERFARIDLHEAGYTMLCRSTDEELDKE